MNSSSETAIRKPFIDHIYELRRRLLICAAFIAVGGGIGYYLNDTLVRLIQKPLGEKLYYTSPTGGFNFIFVLCLSFGLLVAAPCIIYQVLAFMRPLLPHAKRAHMFWYPACAVFLAALGVAFAYFISLPAALHFLTTIGGKANIQSLITTDSYFRFALAYLLGFAVLFQLPLLMSIANRVTPLKPSKLMKGQRYVILGSFIIAAILTPTPDPFNQALMAGPIILLYQISVILVWIINMRRKPKKPVVQPSHAVRTPPVRTPVASQQRKPQPQRMKSAFTQLTAAMAVPAHPIAAPRPVPVLSSQPQRAVTGVISDFGPQVRRGVMHPNQPMPARARVAPRSVPKLRQRPAQPQWSGNFSDIIAPAS